MAKLNIKGLKAGSRIGMGEKKHSTDFALWKFSGKPGERQQEWASPWGLGFPGWHIECSAMSMKYLGETFDVHTGGEDHIPVHHTNEIAQSESATGKKFVNYWLHEAFLLFKGEKVSKSKGGLYTIDELNNLGYDPLVYRYLNLLAHYRKPMNFSLDLMDSAKNALKKIKRKLIELKKNKHSGKDKTKEYESEFLYAINNDLNTPLAVQVLHRVIDDESFDSEKRVNLIEKFDSVFGLNLTNLKEEKVIVPKDVAEMVKERENMRREKRWAESDILRQRIKERGFLVEDRPEGARIVKE